MAFEILTSQFAVEATVIITLLLTLGLAAVISQRYLKKRSLSLLFWSSGIWLFVIGMFQELLFAVGVYSSLLINSYLFIVALLVEALALGSIQLVKSNNIRNGYYVFVVLSTLLLAYSLVASPVGNIITDWIVYGNLPLFVALTSSLVTFPAAIVLAGVAIKGYLKTRSRKLLSIITGVIIVSIAGTLYIVQYPAFLYIAEFVGILALWYGFI